MHRFSRQASIYIMAPTTDYRTPFTKERNDYQNYLHAKSEHTFSHQKITHSYSQMLRIKLSCSTFNEYRKQSQDLIKKIC